MKALKLFIFLCFFSIRIFSMEANYKSVEGECVISRAAGKTGNYSFNLFYLNNFKPWFAIAVEPYFRMSCFAPKNNIVTSPIKTIKRKSGKFLIYTVSGSIYSVSKKKIISVKSMDEFIVILT